MFGKNTNSFILSIKPTSINALSFQYLLRKTQVISHTFPEDMQVCLSNLRENTTANTAKNEADSIQELSWWENNYLSFRFSP